MKGKKLHYSDDKFLEYYYDREAGGELGGHLLSCQLCGSHYLKMQRTLDDIRSALGEEVETHWGAQRQRIMTRLHEPVKQTPAMPWRQFAPIAVAMLIVVGLIFSFNSGQDRASLDNYYLKLSHNDDLLLDEIDNLMERPLSQSMDSINFWMDLADQYEKSGALELLFRKASHAET